MKGFWDSLRFQPEEHLALVDARGRSLTYGALREQLERASAQFSERGVQRVCCFLPNSIATVVQLLGALDAGVTLIPVAPFASSEQMAHVLATCVPDCILTVRDAPEAVTSYARGADCQELPFPTGLLGTEGMLWLSKQTPAGGLGSQLAGDDAPALVTFTSGSTGRPKGACLDARTLDATSAALQGATAMNGSDRHLCLHPFAVLLELVGGLLRPLRAGAQVHLPELEPGLVCCSEGPAIVRGLAMARATSAILVPEMLGELVRVLESAEPGELTAATRALRFVGVGGAVLPGPLLRRSEALGLSVFQGYGATECGSVIALNGPGANRVGSVGRPLPHLDVSIAEDGEVLVGGHLFRGYVGDACHQHGRSGEVTPWHTGDLGFLDDQGFLHLRGRKSNVFSTPLGRNVSAEWLESRLLALPAVQQAVVFGEGFPAPVAVLSLWPEGAEDIATQVHELNESLPSYARLHRFHVSPVPLSVEQGLWCATGRPKRAAIFQAFEPFLRFSEAPVCP